MGGSSFLERVVLSSQHDQASLPAARMKKNNPGKKQHLIIMLNGEIWPPADTDLSRFVDAVEVDADEFSDYPALCRKLRKLKNLDPVDGN